MTFNKNNFIIWDILTSQNIKTFLSSDDLRGSLEWNFDGAWISKNTKTHINVYEAPDFQMIKDVNNKKTSINVNNLIEFKWNPVKNMFAFIEELQDTSSSNAAVKIIGNFPQRTILR